MTWEPADLLAYADAPPLLPTIGGIVYPGLRHVVSGEPDALKTWAMLTLGVGELRAGRDVVYADLENGGRIMLERLRALGVDDETIRRLVYIEQPDIPLTGRAADAVRRLVAERRPSLVILDGFTGMLGLHDLNPNSAADVERFYREVVKLFGAHGAAVVILDHLPKDREKRGTYAIGSERKIGRADVHLSFELDIPGGRGRCGAARVWNRKDRPGRLRNPKGVVASYVLTSDSETGAVEAELRIEPEACDDGGFRPAKLMERVSRYVEGRSEPPSVRDVRARTKGKAEYVGRAVELLIVEGFMVEESGPHRAKLLRSVRPFREGEPAP